MNQGQVGNDVTIFSPIIRLQYQNKRQLKIIIYTQNHSKLVLYIKYQMSQQEIYETPSTIQKYLRAFFIYARQRIIRLSVSVVGEVNYTPKYQLPFAKKQKIFKYLQAKYITTISSSQQKQRKSALTTSTPFSPKQIFSLQELKQQYLSRNSYVEGLQCQLQSLKSSSQYIKSNFFNEIAYQFDKQRYCSMAWGLLFGSLICTTIYRKGSLARKTALFLTCGHVMGQISYHVNVDKYFDITYEMFKEDAEEFVKREGDKNDDFGSKSDFAGIVED